MKSGIVRIFFLSSLFLSVSLSEGSDVEAMSHGELVKAYRTMEKEKNKSEGTIKNFVNATLESSKNDWESILKTSEGKYQNSPNCEILEKIQQGTSRISLVFGSAFPGDIYAKTLLGYYFINQINGLFDYFVENYRIPFYGELIEKTMIGLYVQHAKECSLQFGVNFEVAFETMRENIQKVGGIEKYRQLIQKLQIPAPPPPPPPPGFSDASKKTWQKTFTSNTVVKIVPKTGTSIFNAAIGDQFLQKVKEREERQALLAAQNTLYPLLTTESEGENYTESADYWSEEGSETTIDLSIINSPSHREMTDDEKSELSKKSFLEKKDSPSLEGEVDFTPDDLFSRMKKVARQLQTQGQSSSSSSQQEDLSKSVLWSDEEDNTGPDQSSFEDNNNFFNSLYESMVSIVLFNESEEESSDLVEELAMHKRIAPHIEIPSTSSRHS